MYPHCTHIFAKWCNDLQKGFCKFGCISIIYEKFDLNGVADLGLKVVRLSPLTHLVFQMGFLFIVRFLRLFLDYLQKLICIS